jgi:hypothetical protein
MVDLNAHATGNGGKKPREAYSLPSLLYSESSDLAIVATSCSYASSTIVDALQTIGQSMWLQYWVRCEQKNT